MNTRGEARQRVRNFEDYIVEVAANFILQSLDEHKPEDVLLVQALAPIAEGIAFATTIEAILTSMGRFYGEEKLPIFFKVLKDDIEKDKSSAKWPEDYNWLVENGFLIEGIKPEGNYKLLSEFPTNSIHRFPFEEFPFVRFNDKEFMIFVDLCDEIKNYITQSEEGQIFLGPLGRFLGLVKGMIRELRDGRKQIIHGFGQTFVFITALAESNSEGEIAHDRLRELYTVFGYSQNKLALALERIMRVREEIRLIREHNINTITFDLNCRNQAIQWRQLAEKAVLGQ